jgi:membrane protease YdiL (CAAX protease family)
MNFSTKPNRRETLWGGIYLILYMSVLPRLVPIAVALLAPGLDAVWTNFIFFSVNFLAAVVIFRRLLLHSLGDAVKVPGRTLCCALLGYFGSQLLGNYVSAFIYRIEPNFANVNNEVIYSLVAENFLLMGIGAVILAPIAEELLFRGLVFRILYDRSPPAAHLVSMALFSFIHITGYLGRYEPKLLLLCFIQYLPSAYCLNFAYRHSGTIIAPILTHMLINLAALFAMR